MTIKNRVFITDYDLCSCSGEGILPLWEDLLLMRSKITQQDGFLNDAPACIGLFSSKKKFLNLLIECISNVVLQSNINTKETLLLVGSSVGGMQNTEKMIKNGKEYSDINPEFHTIVTIENLIKPHFEFKDSFSFSTACTSSANALGFAYECIKKGLYEKVLVVGADAISLTTVCGFNALGVLSQTPCKPFDINNDGMNVSDGIGVLLLQNRQTLNCVELLGAGYSSDAHHMTHPDPTGEGAKMAINEALKCANLKPEDITYINAHGTGTVANDETESSAIEAIFSNKVYISSTKGVSGHTLGASGAIEAIITCKALHEEIIPPNVNLQNAKNQVCKFATQPIKIPIKYAMSNSFAFGGNNTSLVFGKIN